MYKSRMKSRPPVRSFPRRCLEFIDRNRDGRDLVTLNLIIWKRFINSLVSQSECRVPIGRVGVQLLPTIPAP